MTLDEMLAREGIRDTQSRYNINGDRGKVDELAATFADDGVLELFSGLRLVGPAAIAERLGSFKKANTRLRFAHHQLSTSLIEIDGDIAKARTYFMVMSNGGPDHAGVYTDRLRKVGERWLFEHRLVQLDWQSPDSVFPKMQIEPANSQGE